MQHIAQILRNDVTNGSKLGRNLRSNKDRQGATCVRYSCKERKLLMEILQRVPTFAATDISKEGIQRSLVALALDLVESNPTIVGSVGLQLAQGTQSPAEPHSNDDTAVNTVAYQGSPNHAAAGTARASEALDTYANNRKEEGFLSGDGGTGLDQRCVRSSHRNGRQMSYKEFMECLDTPQSHGPSNMKATAFEAKGTRAATSRWSERAMQHSCLATSFAAHNNPQHMLHGVTSSPQRRNAVGKAVESVDHVYASPTSPSHVSDTAPFFAQLSGLSNDFLSAKPSFATYTSSDFFTARNMSRLFTGPDALTCDDTGAMASNFSDAQQQQQQQQQQAFMQSAGHRPASQDDALLPSFAVKRPRSRRLPRTDFGAGELTRASFLMPGAEEAEDPEPFASLNAYESSNLGCSKPWLHAGPSDFDKPLFLPSLSQDAGDHALRFVAHD